MAADPDSSQAENDAEDDYGIFAIGGIDDDSE
jgi:hypothetical protein